MKGKICAVLTLAFVPVITGAAELQNPVKFPDIAHFIEGALQAIVYIALPIIAFFIVYAGFLFVKARGNSGQLERAKENFVWVVLGSALILGAWVLATLIASTVTNLVK